MKFKTILKGNMRDEETSYGGFASGTGWLRNLGKRREFWEKL